MKDFDIHVKGTGKVTLFGTDNGTITAPVESRIDSDKYNCDIDVNTNEDIIIGVPSDTKHIEIAIADTSLIIKDLDFDNLEIDAKGSVKIKAVNISGKLDINLSDSVADLSLPEGFTFRTVTEGKNNRLNNSRTESASAANIIELNGKNSVLNIR